MFIACLLLAVAIVSGTLLTFIFDRTAPFPARLCMGACIGTALLATVGFVLASAAGLRLGTACLWISAGILLLPALLLVRTEYRNAVHDSISNAWQSAISALRHRHGWVIGYAIFYFMIAIVLGMVFSAAVYQNPQGIFTGITNNLGDLPLHMQVIFSFAQGQNFPPQDPTFAGVRFAYPFLCDFLTAMLVRAGADIISAMWLQNMLLAVALTGLLHYWTVLLTRSRLAGLIAPALVLFSGGLGWTWIFNDVRNSDNGLIPLLGHLPRDYTIAPDSVLRWGNSLTTLFVPQRSILFGMPLAIVIFCQWWLAIASAEDGSNEKPTRACMIAAGAMAGLLPLIHSHTFLVVMTMGICLAIIFRSAWRNWLWFFLTAGVIALPEVFWLSQSALHTQNFLGWHLGWDHAGYPVVWFWLVNAGLFLPALLLALLWPNKNTGLPRRLLLFYLPFLLCFIVPNFIKLAPWVWDNIKVLFYWYAASVPLVAWLLAKGIEQRSYWRWISAGALAAMLLSGGLDILRVVTDTTVNQEFDIHGIEMAQAIEQRTTPHAVVLHAPTYNTPVFLTGRRSLLGYDGWMWSRGLDSTQRHADVERMYAGGAEAEALLKQYHVEYVLISPAELASIKVNQQFWSQHPMVVETGGEYRLYKTNIQEERARK